MRACVPADLHMVETGARVRACASEAQLNNSTRRRRRVVRNPEVVHTRGGQATAATRWQQQCIRACTRAPHMNLFQNRHLDMRQCGACGACVTMHGDAVARPERRRCSHGPGEFIDSRNGLGSCTLSAHPRAVVLKWLTRNVDTLRR